MSICLLLWCSWLHGHNYVCSCADCDDWHMAALAACVFLVYGISRNANSMAMLYVECCFCLSQQWHPSIAQYSLIAQWPQQLWSVTESWPHGEAADFGFAEDEAGISVSSCGWRLNGLPFLCCQIFSFRIYYFAFFLYFQLSLLTLVT